MKTRLFAPLMLVLLSTAPMPALAQSDAPLTFQPANPDDPVEALSRYLRLLSSNPRSLEALTGAGQAALQVGDANAAVGFYARAQEVAPRNGRVKAGLGAALVQMEQPREALKLFDQAVDLGVPEADIAADRGLAHDLRGENRRALADYQLALRGRPDDETVRRMALCMAILGDKAGALAALDPLLRKQDKPAWRARTFVLALTGDGPGAREGIAQLLPRPQAEAMAPFLTRLTMLKSRDKALAVHFGRFPSDGRPTRDDTQLADASSSNVAGTADTPLIPSGAPLGAVATASGFSDRFATGSADPAAKASRRRPGRETLVLRTDAARAGRSSPQTSPAASTVQSPSQSQAERTAVRSPTPAPPSAEVAALARALAPTPAPTAAPTPTPPVQIAAATPVPASSADGQPLRAATAAPPAGEPATPATAPAQAFVGSTAPGFDLAVLGSPARTDVPIDSTPAASVPPAVAPTAQAVGSPAVTTPAVTAPKPVAGERLALATDAAGSVAKDRTTPAAISASRPRGADQPKDTKAASTPVKLALVKAGDGKVDATQPVKPKADAKAKDGASARMKKDASATGETAKDAGKKGIAKKDATAKGVATKEASAKESKTKDVKGKDAAGKDAKGKDAKAATATASRKAPERHWVQVAGGANKSTLPKAWAGLKAKYPKELAGKSPWTTPLRFTNRLLVGPFKSAGEAQAFVNSTAKSGWTTFTFTSPAGQDVEKLAL
ncbi:SPOR domain-containing protein [Sphingomonas sp. 1P06PA]|uniref:SPOR domain-containing protein n=1 Tax=Sphingomonas sp. 1P06PA TaxID=554121 RepID=UPI0039A4214A